MWNEKFTEFIQNYGLQQTKLDLCDFTNKNHIFIIACRK